MTTATATTTIRTPAHLDAIRDARHRLAVALVRLRANRRTLATDRVAFLAAGGHEGVDDYRLFEAYRQSRWQVDTAEQQVGYAADRLDYLTGDYD